MDKYAVVLDEEKVKTAGTDQKCPKCGTDLPSATPNKNGDVIPPYYCPNCGTEPFEKKPSTP